MTRKEILDTAAKCVLGDREQDYGTPESNFALIANLWSGYTGVKFDAQDVACMMILMKLARIRNGGGTGDSYVDIAGYAACGGEILGNKIGPAKTEKEEPKVKHTAECYGCVYQDPKYNYTCNNCTDLSMFKNCDICHWYGKERENKPCGRCGPFANQFKVKEKSVNKCQECHWHSSLLNRCVLNIPCDYNNQFLPKKKYEQIVPSCAICTYKSENVTDDLHCKHCHEWSNFRVIKMLNQKKEEEK